MKNLHSQNGFTLVEVIIAIAILSIGIFTLLTMQTTSINGNASANNITAATVVGADEIEQILRKNYADDSLLKDTDNDKLAGLDDFLCCQDGKDPSGTAVTGCTDDSDKADSCLQSGNYFIYVNVAVDEPLSSSPDTTKTIRVYVQGPNNSGNPKTVSFNYFRTLSL